MNYPHNTQTKVGYLGAVCTFKVAVLDSVKDPSRLYAGKSAFHSPRLSHSASRSVSS